ncbi:MAG TPA: hypothetical protein VHI13_18055 [Candidatus Kapabacteria bacterium]|nr:hypothetical protein [Candidatus Kapabacteria bacterium]
MSDNPSPRRHLYVLYRATGGDNPKNRPSYYSKMLCLKSFLRAFARVQHTASIVFFNDGPMPENRLAIERAWGEVVALAGIGNSPSYRVALSRALTLPEDAIVYFAEDDYLYTEAALERMLLAFEEIPRADYVTLFDHRDRYIRTDDSRRGYSRVFIGAGMHWRTVESTCMTFGARVSRLKRDAWIHRLGTAPRTPRDRHIWRLTLGEKWFLFKFPKRTLIAPIPSLATHMDPEGLGPNVDWERVAREAEAFDPMERPPLGLQRD